MTRFLSVLCTVVSLNTDIGHIAKLKSPSATLPVCPVSAFLPHDVIVLLAGYLMIAHIYAVSLEVALIAAVLILTIAVLYYRFGPGNSYLVVLASLAFLLKIPYAVPLLVGLGGDLAFVIPVSCGVFLYYLLIYMKQDAGILVASGDSVDIVQKYSQIPRSMLFNQTTMATIATCAVDIIMVYFMCRLSMDYAWMVTVVTGSMTKLLVIFVGDFVFRVSVSMGPMILEPVLSAAITAVFNFFVLSVDCTRTEYMQFEDDDYYYCVKAVSETAIGTPGVKIQKTGTHKRGTRKKNPY